MGRLWSNWATDAHRIATALALVALIAGCGRGERTANGDVPPAAEDDVPFGTLPTPAVAPGASVTGMPTQPPPPRAVEPDVAAPGDALPATADGAAPVDPDTPVDPGAPLPAPPTDAPAPTDATTPAAPVDVAGANATVTQYMAALSAGAFARGQGLWSTTPNDGAVIELARGDAFNVAIGTATADPTGHAAVPVDIRGRAADGSARHIVATYSLQRDASGAWRIASAAVRDAGP